MKNLFFFYINVYKMNGGGGEDEEFWNWQNYKRYFFFGKFWWLFLVCFVFGFLVLFMRLWEIYKLEE